MTAQNFRRDENDAQRNRRLDRRGRDVHHPERRERERDAMRDGERGNRFHEQTHAAHDEDQRENEEQMVDAEENVLYPEDE